jgi:hypothetical protein
MKTARMRCLERFDMAIDAHHCCNDECMHKRSRNICYGYWRAPLLQWTPHAREVQKDLPWELTVPLLQWILHAQMVEKDLQWLLTRTFAAMDTASAIGQDTKSCCGNRRVPLLLWTLHAQEVPEDLQWLLTRTFKSVTSQAWQ